MYKYSKILSYLKTPADLVNVVKHSFLYNSNLYNSGEKFQGVFSHRLEFTLKLNRLRFSHREKWV